MTIAAAGLLYLALFVLPPFLIPSAPFPAVSPAPAVSPPTFADIAKAESDARGNLVGALGVMAVLIGGFVGVANFLASRRQNLDTLELTRRGQLAERFTKAIEQLGHPEAPDLAIRLGGIYALEQISRDSEEFHWPVMEVLTAFLRVNSNPSPEVASTSADTRKGAGPRQNPDGAPPQLAPDLQAAATVVGRRGDERRQRERKNEQRLDLSAVALARGNLRGGHLEEADLRDANLEEADLRDAHLEEADLSGANLEGADLRDAHLEGAHAYLNGAHLRGANLEGAHLNGAHLEEAELIRANLGGANLSDAHLEGADLADAHLEGANLAGAHLQGTYLGSVNGLTREQLEGAVANEQTILPPELEDATMEKARKSQPSYFARRAR